MFYEYSCLKFTRLKLHLNLSYT